MLGAIAGDIIGSRFEGDARVPYRFRLFEPDSSFTDDTVCTLAIADALMGDGNYGASLRRFVRRHPDRDYGQMFLEWAMDPNARAYRSWGNGAPMRCAAIGWFYNTERQVLGAAARQARVTHNTIEAVQASKAVALAILLLRKRAPAADVAQRLSAGFGYILGPPPYEATGFDASAEGTTQQALSAALFATSWSDAVRRVIRLGGDTDTLAAIAGGVAEARFGLPNYVARNSVARLPEDLKAVWQAFSVGRVPPRGEADTTGSSRSLA